ncbi:quinate 5-dehydrogenase [Heliorestis convoluta]|uniref:quinate 5-dehydrogenase n=1 Tax=Heliorestis convoluta TaxID=356322 RepID=UPI00129A26D8|nr:quinate 5-dehydrogenase [Heliorestis convoluta]
MKKVVSVSLGSSRRNHQVHLSLLGQEVSIERIGTDGDMERAVQLIRNLDGKVDAIGLGGIDLYIFAGSKRYVLKDGAKLAQAARITPVVDGSGLKNTLERQVVFNLAEQGLLYRGQKVLVVCAVDRFGLAESLEKVGCRTTYGDLYFGLGIPIALHRLETLQKWAQLIIPVISKVPFHYLYPTGNKQEKKKTLSASFIKETDVIAGDFHFIKRYMLEQLEGKVILTNTVTAEDVDLLKGCGVSRLVTTTPEIAGRSFGTNVMEALFVALTSSSKEKESIQSYTNLIKQLDWQPRIVNFYCNKTA